MMSSRRRADVSSRQDEGRFRLVTSGLVEQEIALAPDQVQEFFVEVAAKAELIESSIEAISLRDA